MNGFILLLLAIVSEVIGTTAMKASDGFSKFWPSVIMVIGYIATFSFLSLTLKELPLGTAYAIWAGLGTAATVIIGVVVWRETLGIWHILGIIFIIVGVVMLNFVGGEAHG